MKPLALVIDRDAGTRKLLDVLLTRFGYDVDRVALAADALALLERIDYDFVLADDERVAVWISDHRSAALQRMMILTSALDLELGRMKDDWPNVRIIRKPFELADVIEASREAAFNRPQREPHICEGFWRHSVSNGAKAGLLLRRAGDNLELVTQFGYDRGTLDAWFPLAVNAPYPICAGVRLGRPVWLASVANATEYPLLATVCRTNHTRALAVVPVMREGEVIGAAGWSFREPQRFTEAEKRAWTALAADAASLVEGGMPAQSSSGRGA